MKWSNEYRTTQCSPMWRLIVESTLYKPLIASCLPVNLLLRCWHLTPLKKLYSKIWLFRCFNYTSHSNLSFSAAGGKTTTLLGSNSMPWDITNCKSRQKLYHEAVSEWSTDPGTVKWFHIIFSCIYNYVLRDITATITDAVRFDRTGWRCNAVCNFSTLARA